MSLFDDTKILSQMSNLDDTKEIDISEFFKWSLEDSVHLNFKTVFVPRKGDFFCASPEGLPNAP
jgi:hypothetical protein